jgi:AcrR family transcriptional regulator
VEITRRAGVNRSTFYLYYRDKDDVFFSLHQGIIDRLCGGNYTKEELVSVEPPKQLVEAFQFALKDRRVYKLIVIGKLTHIIEKGVREQISREIRSVIKDLCHNSPTVDSSLLAEFIASGQIPFIVECARSQRWRGSYSALDIATQYHTIRRAVIMGICQTDSST